MGVAPAFFIGVFLLRSRDECPPPPDEDRACGLIGSIVGRFSGGRLSILSLALRIIAVPPMNGGFGGFLPTIDESGLPLFTPDAPDAPDAPIDDEFVFPIIVAPLSR
jgi:hypothetical protein